MEIGRAIGEIRLLFHVHGSHCSNQIRIGNDPKAARKRAAVIRKETGLIFYDPNFDLHEELQYGFMWV